MSTAQQVNYVDIINDIEDFYVENSINVYTPVPGTQLKYKPLSVEQLKLFIELQVSASKDEFGVLPGLAAVEMLNDITVNNCIDYKDKVMASLSIIDRDAVILQLRNDIKSEINLSQDVDSDDVIVDLSDIVLRLKKAKFPKTNRTRSKVLKYKSGSFTVDIKLPSLQVDSDINAKFKKLVVPSLSKGTKHVEKNVDKILSKVYFLEIYKYIDTVTIVKGDGKTVVNFRDLDNFDQNFLLLDKLPSQVVATVSDYMSDVRKFRDSMFYYEDEDGKHVPLDIDLGLFAGI
jgi:hypothetical protein